MEMAEVYAEVLILLNYYLIPDEFSKIPQDKLEFMANHADKNFILEIDEEKPFSEQKISKEAKAIILSLYKKYFITSEQGKRLNQLLKNIETKASGKDEISFEDRIKQVNENKKIEDLQLDKNDKKELVKVTFFQKVINKIKEIFKKNK